MAPELDAVLAAAGLVEPRPAGPGRRGVTWQARHPDGAQWVALKVIPLPHDRARRRFLAEVAVLRDLPPDPDLVAVLDAGVVPDGRAWLVTPWMEGGSLAAALESGGWLPAGVVGDAAEEAARGWPPCTATGWFTPTSLRPICSATLTVTSGSTGWACPAWNPTPARAGRAAPRSGRTGRLRSSRGARRRPVDRGRGSVVPWCLPVLPASRPPPGAMAGERPAAQVLAMAAGPPRGPEPPGIPSWLSGLVRACLALEPEERPAGAGAVAAWAAGARSGRSDTLAPTPVDSEGRPLGSRYLLLDPLGQGSSGQVGGAGGAAGRPGGGGQGPAPRAVERPRGGGPLPEGANRPGRARAPRTW